MSYRNDPDDRDGIGDSEELVQSGMVDHPGLPDAESFSHRRKRDDNCSAPGIDVPVRNVPADLLAGVSDFVRFLIALVVGGFVRADQNLYRRS